MKYQKNFKTASPKDFAEFNWASIGLDPLQVIDCRAEVEAAFAELTLVEAGNNTPAYVTKDGLRWRLERGRGFKSFPKKEGGGRQQHIWQLPYIDTAGGKKVDAKRVVIFLDNLRKEDQGTSSAPRTVSNCSGGLKSDVCTELINKLSKDPDCYNRYLDETEPRLRWWVQKLEERAHVLVAE